MKIRKANQPSSSSAGKSEGRNSLTRSRRALEVVGEEEDGRELGHLGRLAARARPAGSSGASRSPGGRKRTSDEQRGRGDHRRVHDRGLAQLAVVERAWPRPCTTSPTAGPDHLADQEVVARCRGAPGPAPTRRSTPSPGPTPSRASVTAKSERVGGELLSHAPPPRPARRTASLKARAARRVVREHVERRAGGGEQHGVAGRGAPRGRARPLPRMIAQATTGTTAASASRDAAARLADGEHGLAVRAQRRAQVGEVAALVAAADDGQHRAGERLQALARRVDVGGLGVVEEDDARGSRPRAPARARRR